MSEKDTGPDAQMAAAIAAIGVGFHHGFYHGITVAELRALLDELPDFAVLIPNRVLNLAVYIDRSAEMCDGIVDLGKHEVTMYT